MATKSTSSDLDATDFRLTSEFLPPSSSRECQHLTGKKVFLLSRLNDNTLVRFIDGIRQTGHRVVLLATTPGINNSLNEKNYDHLAAQLRTVYMCVTDPPPVVMVTSSSQLLPFLEALDPDLVISYRFPYQLTQPFLAHRSIKINMHPSPLPLYRGAEVYSRAVLQQVPRWAITWHYITESYDSGNIIIQEFFELNSPYTVQDIYDQSTKLILKTLDEVIRLALAGYPGRAQQNPASEQEQYANGRPFTLAERTITSGLSCDEVRNLVEACKFTLPALLQVDQRLYHVIEARRLETPLPSTMSIGEIKRKLTRYVQQCADGLMEYVVQIV